MLHVLEIFRVPGPVLVHYHKRWLANCGLLIATKIIHIGRVIVRNCEVYLRGVLRYKQASALVVSSRFYMQDFACHLKREPSFLKPLNLSSGH